MNNKGFTLVELLAVILILSLLALLANTSVTKVVRDSKSDLYDSQLQIIKLAAESWGSENIDKLPDSGQCKYITLGDLKNYGLMDSSVKNPKTDKEFSDDLNIKIVGTENKYGKINITYEVDPEDINGCEVAVVEKTIDTICTHDTTNGVAEKTAGAKYTCEVKEGTSYNFYVLTTPKEGDTTINLIMDQNVNSDGTPAGMTGTTKSGENVYNLVPWNNESGQSTNAYGPVTAMQFLYNATKDWTNIDPVNYTYNDRTVQGNADGKGYTSFVSSNGVAVITPLTGDGVTIGTSAEPLRARMPIYASEASVTEVTSKTDATAYLYDNLRTNNVGPYGYWTLSSSAGISNYAWNVYYNGYVIHNYVYYGNYYGVRPVINLKL